MQNWLGTGQDFWACCHPLWGSVWKSKWGKLVSVRHSRATNPSEPRWWTKYRGVWEIWHHGWLTSLSSSPVLGSQLVLVGFWCKAERLTQASEVDFTKHPDISWSISHGSVSAPLEKSLAKVCWEPVYLQSFMHLQICGQNIEAVSQNEEQSCRWSLVEQSTVFAFLPCLLPMFTPRCWLDPAVRTVLGILVPACSTAWIQQKCSWSINNMKEILHPSGSKQGKNK